MPKHGQGQRRSRVGTQFGCIQVQMRGACAPKAQELCILWKSIAYLYNVQSNSRCSWFLVVKSMGWKMWMLSSEWRRWKESFDGGECEVNPVAWDHCNCLLLVSAFRCSHCMLLISRVIFCSSWWYILRYGTRVLQWSTNYQTQSGTELCSPFASLFVLDCKLGWLEGELHNWSLGEMLHQRSKQILIKYHSLWDVVEEGRIVMCKIDTRLNVANVEVASITIWTS